MTRTHHYRPTLFFVLAFAITWIGGFLLIWQGQQSGSLRLGFLLLAYLGPFLAALVMMYGFADRAFRADFRKRIYDLKLINVNSLPFALFVLPVAMVGSILISLAFGQPVEQLRFAEEFKVFSGEALLSMIILILVPILEELGWRGYGVDSLTSRFNLFNSSLLFGVLWSLWHLPSVFMEGSYQNSLWAQHPIFAINFFVGIIPLAVITNYLFYKNGRSIFLLALFHIIVNFSAELFGANQISKCILTLVLTGVATILVVRNKEFFFREKQIAEARSAPRLAMG